MSEISLLRHQITRYGLLTRSPGIRSLPYDMGRVSVIHSFVTDWGSWSKVNEYEMIEIASLGKQEQRRRSCSLCYCFCRKLRLIFNYMTLESPGRSPNIFHSLFELYLCLTSHLVPRIIHFAPCRASLFLPNPSNAADLHRRCRKIVI